MKEVADGMLRQFADQLAAEVVDAPQAVDATPSGRSEPAPVDVGKLAGAAIAPRVARPALLVAAGALLVAMLLRRRHR